MGVFPYIYKDMEKKAPIIASAVHEKANTSEQEPITILESAKDLEIVSEAILNPPGPNQILRNAAEVYNLFIEDNK